GETPSQIIQWLIQNDFSGQPQFRQYGIAAIVDGEPEAAAYTGSATDDYKNHITGPYYAIQGNILLGQQILDSMEAHFLDAEGDLACRLMAALQGANVMGADTRCTPNGTSSLFAFVKVAQPDDTFGDPSFKLSVRTNDGQGQEPIDLLQALFDDEKSCESLTSISSEHIRPLFEIYPHPTGDKLQVKMRGEGRHQLVIQDLYGRVFVQADVTRQQRVDVASLPSGIYMVTIEGKGEMLTCKWIKN
ncbi:MAG: DUF1028 domain-containing protein, partial [Bacteroidota bacterium]